MLVRATVYLKNNFKSYAFGGVYDMQPYMEKLVIFWVLFPP